MHPRPPPDYWYISVFLLVGPGPLHETVVSAFRVVQGACKYVFTPTSCLNPPYISKCFSSFTFCLRASLSLSSILYSTSVLYPPNFSMDSTSSRSPKPFLSFSTTLSHLFPAPSVVFSHTALSAMAGNLFSRGGGLFA